MTLESILRDPQVQKRLEAMGGGNRTTSIYLSKSPTSQQALIREELTELEQECTALRRLNELRQEKLDLLAKLEEGQYKDNPSAMRLRSILDDVAAISGVSVSLIKSKDRTSKVCNARGHYFHEARKAGFPSTKIGKLVNRDHGTVLHWVKAHSQEQQRSNSVSVGT